MQQPGYHQAGEKIRAGTGRRKADVHRVSKNCHQPAQRGNPQEEGGPDNFGGNRGAAFKLKLGPVLTGTYRSGEKRPEPTRRIQQPNAPVLAGAPLRTRLSAPKSLEWLKLIVEVPPRVTLSSVMT